MIHPVDVLFAGEKPFPAIPVCDHYAGSEKLIRKALEIQAAKGPVFDITMDCEDGARKGEELAHARMVAQIAISEENRFHRLGVRIHDPASYHWRRDVEEIIPVAGERLAYLTIPKVVSGAQVQEMASYIAGVAASRGISRKIPLHILIETHGALEEAEKIAEIEEVECLDFGLMDYVSGFLGALPVTAMRSPGQFDHPVVRSAKVKIVTAAISRGAVPAHNVCVDLKNVGATREDARRAREEFGFLRMWSIHPNQIDPIVDAMMPDHSELERAVAILTKAQENSWGPIDYNGELHDRASYRAFWTIVKQARTSGIALPGEVLERWFSPDHPE